MNLDHITTVLGKAIADKLGHNPIPAIRGGNVSELMEQYRLTKHQAEKVCAVRGISAEVAVMPLPVGQRFNCAKDLFHHFGPRMRDLKVEQFWVVHIDAKHRIIRKRLVSQGTLSSSPVHPREVFVAAIKDHAAAIIVLHNHPTGDPTPSADDLEITRRLCEGGELLGIRLLDHIVIGDTTFVSLADRGLLN